MSDQRYMQLALSLGRRGWGRVWPNPSVGCVIVKDGVIVGRGRTADGGRPHAETQALQQAGTAAKGATAFVTLEPCAHTGRTPPCTRALITAGISRVVIPIKDPDPRVNGRGVAALKAANVTVDIGICAAEAQQDHQGFLQRQTAQRPLLTLKLAQTLDGRIATRSGHSQWITCAQSRRMVHAMRSRHDAIMIGAGTARADDPQLNVRGMGEISQPVRVVLSSELDLEPARHLANTASQQPVWLVHRPGVETLRWENRGAVCLAQDPTDVTAVMKTLAEKGLTRVFCEGGGTLAASLLKAGLVDELIIMSAGCAIGADGAPALQGLDIDDLANAPRFDLVMQQQLGEDVMTRWQPRTAT